MIVFSVLKVRKFHFDLRVVTGIASYRFIPKVFRKHLEHIGCSDFRSKRPNALDIVPNMPKYKDNSVLRLQRIKSRAVKQDQPRPRPSEIYLCILGNGAKGSPRALYMFTDQGRYLFNCGEGMQRLAHEHKTKLSKLEHIFITHKSWENVGGLIGLSLTVQDIGVPDITLHGPRGIEKLYSMTRTFALTRELDVVKRGINEPPFVDSCMEVHYIPIYSSCPSVLECPNCSDSSDDSYSSGSESSKEPEQQRCKRMKRMEEETSYDVTVAYVCKGHSKPGHLVLEKCIEQGVPPGPLLGELKNGKDVVLPSGKVVKSQDVVSPEEPCPVFLVVECPSKDFLDPFVNEEKFKAYQVHATNSRDVAAVVVHFTPPDIVKTDKYSSWMHKFSENTQHIILNADNPTLNSIAIHRIQHKLHLVHPQIFSLIYEDEHKVENHCINGTLPNIVQANTLYRFYLRPYKGLDRDSGISLEPAAYIEEATSMPGFHDNLEQLKNSINSVVKKLCPDEEHPEVVFLGTGSSIPSKVRNVSGILVNVSPDCSILLDCGEGTYNQLQRIYGLSAVKSTLQKISCIFISHVHADHHLGLFQILKERQNAFISSGEVYTPVVVIAPELMNVWFLDYHKKFEPIASLFRFVDCSDLKFNSRDVSEESESWLKESCKDVEISTVPVNHCFEAYGVCLASKGAWKLVYSGDTTPCQSLIDAGKNCTLLIHEATMEDDLEDEAAFKMHSTTSQATSIAEKMEAQFTILTHFSQRYAKVPVFSEYFQNQIGCAFDNMRVRHCDLPVVPLFIPTLKCLFAQEVEELLEKGVKRLKKMKSSNPSEVEQIT